MSNSRNHRMLLIFLKVPCNLWPLVLIAKWEIKRHYSNFKLFKLIKNDINMSLYVESKFNKMTQQNSKYWQIGTKVFFFHLGIDLHPISNLAFGIIYDTPFITCWLIFSTIYSLCSSLVYNICNNNLVHCSRHSLSIITWFSGSMQTSH